jgi:hypothetical protein
MAWVVGGAATLLLCVDGWGAETTTPLALNWEQMQTSGTQTQKGRAPLPGGVYVYFSRDVGGGSSDDIFAIISPKGPLCSAMVDSKVTVTMRCGSLTNMFLLYRGEVGGIQVSLVKSEAETPDAAPVATKKKVRL